jgi:hypothetical protein
LDEKRPALPELFTVSEAASFFKTSTNAIHTQISRGKLGPKQGLSYRGRKPYFIAEMLKEAPREGLLAHGKEASKSG